MFKVLSSRQTQLKGNFRKKSFFFWHRPLNYCWGLLKLQTRKSLLSFFACCSAHEKYRVIWHQALVFKTALRLKDFAENLFWLADEFSIHYLPWSWILSAINSWIFTLPFEGMHVHSKAFNDCYSIFDRNEWCIRNGHLSHLILVGIRTHDLFDMKLNTRLRVFLNAEFSITN